jgi:hypothetical protein
MTLSSDVAILVYGVCVDAIGPFEIEQISKMVDFYLIIGLNSITTTKREMILKY